MQLYEIVEILLQSVHIWRLVGYVLLLLAFSDLADTFIPPRFMDSTWEFQTIGRLVERVPVSLIGLILVFSGGSYWRNIWETRLLRLLSWLTLLVGILYLLLIPLGVTNTIRLNNSSIQQIESQYAQQVAQANQIEKQISQATPEQINKLIQRQNPSLNGKNPQELKKQLLLELTKSKEEIKKQSESSKTSQMLGLLKQSVKWNLGALLCGIAFILFWKETPWAR